METFFCKHCGQYFNGDFNLITDFCSQIKDEIQNQKHELISGENFLNDYMSFDYLDKNYKWVDTHLQTSEFLNNSQEIEIVKERLTIVENIAKGLLRTRNLDHYAIQWTNNGIVSSCDDRTLFLSLNSSIFIPIKALYDSISFQVVFASENKEMIKEKYTYIRNTQSTFYDDQLYDIRGLRWNPFIGINYFKSQLLILGESFTWDGVEYGIDDEPDDPQNLIKSILFMPENPNFMNDNFMIEVAKVLLNNETPSKYNIDEFWKKSAFMNLIQPFFKTGTNPKIGHFDFGWIVLLKVAEIIQPKTIIKLGNRRVNRLLKVLLKDKQDWNYDVEDFSRKPYIINLQKNDYKLKIICINHPTRSTNFDLHYWSKIIYENSPELLQIFKKEFC